MTTDIDSDDSDDSFDVLHKRVWQAKRWMGNTPPNSPIVSMRPEDTWEMTAMWAPPIKGNYQEIQCYKSFENLYNIDYCAVFDRDWNKDVDQRDLFIEAHMLVAEFGVHLRRFYTTTRLNVLLPEKSNWEMLVHSTAIKGHPIDEILSRFYYRYGVMWMDVREAVKLVQHCFLLQKRYVLTDSWSSLKGQLADVKCMLGDHCDRLKEWTETWQHRKCDAIFGYVLVRLQRELQYRAEQIPSVVRMLKTTKCQNDP